MNMRRCWSVLALALAAGSAMAVSVQYVPGQVVLRMRPGFTTAILNRTIGATEIQTIAELGNTTVVKLPAKWTVESALRYYRGNTSVLYAEPNYIRHLAYTPNDPDMSKQYSIPIMNVAKAWDFTKGDAKVVVAVVDSGVDYKHVDLTGKVTLGHDYPNNDDDPMDDNGHGTHVAGIIGANTNNSIGIAGIGGNVSILAIKAADKDGALTSANIASAITEAATKGADVINMSFGGYGYTSAESDAVTYALSKNAVLIAAAGNDAVDTGTYPFYPAALTGVVSVGATDAKDTRASFSNYGSHVDIAGPGDLVYSTLPSNSYGLESGTSMASPNVAGVAALMISRVGKGVSNTRVRSVLLKSYKYVGTWLNRGRIDAYMAVRDILPAAETVSKINTLVALDVKPTGTVGDAQVSGDSRAYKVPAYNKPGTQIGMATNVNATWTGLKANPLLMTNAYLTIRSSAMVGASAMYWVWNYTKNDWEFANNFLVGSDYQTLNLPIGSAKTGYSQYIQNGTVKVRLRTVLPSRFGNQSYNFSIDYLSLTTSEPNLK